MRNAVLVSAVRTPVGKMGGVFKNLDRLDLTDVVIKEAIARAGIDSSMVEENIWGNIPRYLTPARYVWLHAGMSEDTACLTVNRGCGTGLSAITTACAMITTGAGDVFGGTAVYQLLQQTAAPEELDEDTLRKITSFACTAASLSTTAPGGASSVPTPEQIQKLLV